MFANLTAYLDSIMARDPAPRSRWEVMLYPGVWAVGFHKLAHWLFEAQLFFLARVINHFSRFLTAIDIHPGAKIGKNFFIDHGFTVIGETCEIGDNVTIYQNVTMGGTNPTNGIGGKRHPTLHDEVIVGSGAQVIGPITIGMRGRIGANAVVMEDVPENTTMVGLKSRATTVPMSEWLAEFTPYATPCDDPCEPRNDCLEKLEAELATLRSEIDALKGIGVNAGVTSGRESDPVQPQTKPAN